MKKKRKLGRKLLSFLLTLAMVVGLMPGMSITVHAEMYSDTVVYGSELKEGDILAVGTAIDLDEKTFKLQANGWCSENGTAGQSDFEISSGPISVSSEGTITISGEKFYPYANGTKVDKWEVISVESDVITLVGYDGITKYPLWVGGIRVTSANADNIDGQSKASYDVTTNTLTLDNYIYEGAGYKFNNSYAGIYYRPNDYEKNLTINLKGTNSVTCRPPHEEEVSLTSINGIYFDNYSNMTIKGDGTLTSMIDKQYVYDVNQTYSIRVSGNLFIEKEAEVVANVSQSNGHENVGVYTKGGKITVNGTLEIKGEQEIGICMDAGNGQMTVTGTLIASGADRAFSINFNDSFQYTVPEGYTVTESGNVDGTDATPVSVGNNTSASAKYVKIMPTPKDPVSYMAWDETEKKLVEKTGNDACKEYEVVTADTTTFEDGKWYVVSNSVTVTSRITVTDTVNLILCDGATLTASKGITVNSGNTINIYAQIGGTGELNAGSDTSVASIGGGERGASSGTVNIHGGKITATGGTNASGIGGALEGGNGEVNIYSGEVTARGQNYAAGIGGYSGKSGGTVNIYGGTVNASGSQYGTTGIGIGGIIPGSCVVHIYGGEVTATSEKAAAGIQGTVTIDGGTVTAKGGVSDAIDCFSGETYSSNGINGTVTVNGGTVTAFGGNVTGGYAAIESYGGTIYASNGINGTVTISGGTVTATGGNVTGDINNDHYGTICACNGVNGTVTISGGTVTATGGSHTGNSSGTTVKEKGFGGSLTIGDSMKVFGGDNADPTTEIEKSNDDYARFKYMLVKLGHVHSFTYEANDATIKATCSQNDCTLNDGQGNHTAILTIGAPTLNTYGQTGAGISAEATITDADNIKGTATVVYKKGDETLASAPTDAGTYTASITLGTVTASVEYTIAQKEVTVSGITASDKIYAGNTDATLVTTAAAFTGKLDGDTLTVSATGTFDNANVGENKTVTISNLTLDGTSKDNYVLAATGQQTTTTAKITAREIDLIWSNTELAYTGEAQKPTATATGVVEGDTCTVTVSGEQTNIGDNYTATAESLSNSNYKLPENKTTAFKITKADAVAATVTANNRTYDGTDKPLVNVDNSTLVGGEMRYALGENATTAPAENLYTTSIPAKTNAGTYYVWYKVNGDANHNNTEPDFVEAKINPVDKAELNKAIKEAEDYYNIIKDNPAYSEQAKALSDAIKAANELADNKNAKDNEVSAGITAVTEAKKKVEAEVKDIDDAAAAKKVTDAINAIPTSDKVATTDKAAIEAARKAYDALSADQKAKVPADTLKKLTDAEKALAVAEANDKAAKELAAAKQEAQASMNEQVTVTQKGNKFTVKWKKAKSADGYYVYAQYCGKKITKPVKTVKKNTTTKVTIKKINGKKLNLKKQFRVYVVPYKIIDGKKVKLGKSMVDHLVGSKSTKYSNVKKLTLKKKKYTVKVGKTAKIKAKVTLVNKNKKHIPKGHGAKFRYKSSDTGIATVDKNGKIKGIKKGTCTIYVYSINGLTKKAKVTVK